METGSKMPKLSVNTKRPGPGGGHQKNRKTKKNNKHTEQQYKYPKTEQNCIKKSPGQGPGRFDRGHRMRTFLELT